METDLLKLHKYNVKKKCLFLPELLFSPSSLESDIKLQCFPICKNNRKFNTKKPISDITLLMVNDYYLFDVSKKFVRSSKLQRYTHFFPLELTF